MRHPTLGWGRLVHTWLISPFIKEGPPSPPDKNTMTLPFTFRDFLE